MTIQVNLCPGNKYIPFALWQVITTFEKQGNLALYSALHKANI